MNPASTLIELAIEREALLFGEFTLKSGRQSPYFFNAGRLCDGRSIATLGALYAQCLIEHELPCDMLFGPAYKGIPLVAATAGALYQTQRINLPWAFNRKEAKTHGEGGQIVGAPLAGKVVVVDDVITAGTAILESFDIISQAGATLAGVIVSMDRQERGQSAHSAIQEIEQKHGVPVYAICNLSALIDYLGQRPDYGAHLANMQAYRERYGV